MLIYTNSFLFLNRSKYKKKTLIKNIFFTSAEVCSRILVSFLPKREEDTNEMMHLCLILSLSAQRPNLSLYREKENLFLNFSFYMHCRIYNLLSIKFRLQGLYYSNTEPHTKVHNVMVYKEKPHCRVF